MLVSNLTSGLEKRSGYLIWLEVVYNMPIKRRQKKNA
jgi:hypothetical protein